MKNILLLEDFLKQYMALLSCSFKCQSDLLQETSVQMNQSNFCSACAKLLLGGKWCLSLIVLCLLLGVALTLISTACFL